MKTRRYLKILSVSPPRKNSRRPKKVAPNRRPLQEGELFPFQERPSIATPPGPEIVIGLICAVGTNTNVLCDLIRDSLARISYSTHQIHLIESVRQLDQWTNIPSTPLDVRYHSLMDAGNEFRAKIGSNEALGLLAAARIRSVRESLSGNRDHPSPRTAYLVRSLKNPSEIEILRRVYGRNFYTIAAYSSEDERLKRLETGIANSRGMPHAADCEGDAKDLLKRDQSEPHLEFGQNVRSAFPLADFFVDSDDSKSLKDSLERIFELVFGNFKHTATKDEYGMFHAFGASVRSASLGRQVGASICSKTGEILTLGCNEVPRAGGGLYWTGDNPDGRDHVLGHDPNDTMKRNLVRDILRKLKDEDWLSDDHSSSSEEILVETALERGGPLEKAHLMNIIEYTRAVHAEMAAITDSALRGIAVQGCTLYTTTFPCHNCAKHIIAAGIARVVYVEPYPKSFSTTLHDDAISLGRVTSGNRIPFESFVGIAPRQFLRLFSMGETVRKAGGEVVKWEPSSAVPRDFENASSYLVREAESILELHRKFQSSQIKAIKPEHAII